MRLKAYIHTNTDMSMCVIDCNDSENNINDNIFQSTTQKQRVY